MLDHYILTPTLLGTVTVASVLTYLVGLVVYRLYFHPLANYPGNFIDKLTLWNDTYRTFTGKRHLIHNALHEKYGDFVRISPDTLSINTAIGLKDIYSSKANVRKSDWYLGLLTYPGAFGVDSAISKPLHSRKRRIMAHAFSETALRSMEPQMTAIVDEWVAKLGESKTAKPGWNMSKWTNYLSMDILGKLCFGESFRTISSETNRFLSTAIMQASSIRYPYGYKPILYSSKLLRRLVFGPIPPFENSPFSIYARSAVNKRMSLDNQSADKDMISWLLEAKDHTTGEGFELKELYTEAVVFISAGSDTASTTMSALLFYLTRSPAKLKKLSDELKGRFATAQDIRSGPELKSCVYLRACLNEALRLAPPVPAILPRTVLAGGIDIDGHHIPEGVTVGTSAYPIHHNPKYYPDPWAFKPERWILDSDAGITAESIQLAIDAFCPFSIGPRGCVGKNMAYLEMEIAIGRLLFTYDLRCSSNLGAGGLKESLYREREDEFQLVDYFICNKEGPEVEFMPRSSVAA